MKIAAVQFHPIFGEIESNLNHIENLLDGVNADLVVLPELCTTGYQFISKKEVAELSELIPEGNTVQRIKKLCQDKKMHIVIGMAEEDNDQYFNSSVLIGPDGYIGKYRKVHLFAEEKIWFEPGNEGFRTWDIGEAKIGMMICFDWIFPESARTLSLLGADIICHPANLVLPYCQDAMMTRSIENRVFTITANRIGTEERGDKTPLTFTGQSQATDTKGKRLFQLEADKEGTGVADINPKEARNKMITPANHCFQDRRDELYFKDNIHE